MSIRSSTARLLAKPGALSTCLGSGSQRLLSTSSRASHLLQHRSKLPQRQCQHRRRYSSASGSISASDLQFGQPVYETHPHLLQPGEVTPGITAREYHERRARLAQSMPKDAVAILPSADIKWRSGAVFFPFRQESNFLYLTGFSEPESLAVIHKTGDGFGDYMFYLLVRPKDPVAEQWSGPWSGIQAAEDVFNADQAGDINQAEQLLSAVLKSSSTVYTDAPTHPRVAALLGSIKPRPAPTTTTSTSPTTPTAKPTSPSAPLPLRPLVNALRIVKSPSEIANMRHAGRVAGRAITSAMRQPWLYEKDLAAYLDHAFTADNCSGPAYVPVVAGGRRANMIHYVLNNAPLTSPQSQSELVLVDAGAEYGTYITDITRTWPLNGKFTAPQRDLYEAVLRVQRAGVKLCRADSGHSLDQIHRATEIALRNELSSLGFDLTRSGALETLFGHHVGHYIGLDVHDCPGFGRNVALQAGHCVTIEPGVYVPADDERWPKHFRGIGIRIEDSVCVDEFGPIVLTTEAVKEVVDIEALRS
ncbi:metallopeptidase [Coniella lustricola]|uniref:Xaa-Pro aminopeptidase n=1 Tax=Coniella lustricola TaxID=2025994 RepID=A0A2T3AI27_9PEZI|nr:metallopeptidase [Coniella lustricola]